MLFISSLGKQCMYCIIDQNDGNELTKYYKYIKRSFEYRQIKLIIIKNVFVI